VSCWNHGEEIKKFLHENDQQLKPSSEAVPRIALSARYLFSGDEKYPKAPAHSFFTAR